MNIEERIRECIENNGVLINDDGTFEEIDSLRFVSTIVALEEEFDIEIPDEYLTFDTMSSLENIKTIVLNLYHGKLEQK
jgi:acyl carrier protein